MEGFGAPIRNIRVPEQSVISRVFEGDEYSASDVENLAWWEAGDKHFDAMPRRVHARRTYGGVEALLIPIVTNKTLPRRRTLRPSDAV